MAGFLSYGRRDNSNIIYLLIISITIFCLFFLFETNFTRSQIASGVSYSSDIIPQTFIAIFRTLCAYITFHAIFIWMIMDKNGAIMYAFFKNEKEILYNHINGVERLVTFSSWNLIILCLFFTSSSLLTWADIFQIPVPEFAIIMTPVLYCTSIGMATFTATIVTYILAPNAIKSGREYDYLFEKHQQMMHNWPVIFLFLDLIFTKPVLSWKFLILGIIIAIVYVIFAYIFASYFGGYYVYQFIDPRLKYSPIILSLLAIAISFFYVLAWIGTKIMEINYFLGSLAFIFWCYWIVLFRSDSIKKKIVEE